MVISIRRLAGAGPRWRSVFSVTGALLVVIDIMLPNG
jgi:hypothetical protein